MDVSQAFWHALNLLATPLGVALLTAVLAAAVWRRWPARRALGWTVAVAVAVWLALLALTGREGTMAAYGALVLTVALTLWATTYRR
ncbi:MAG: hypothetical protein LCH73_15030 [Proteobacteria bacterium]|nr:hypothetical protein [Pseudomonadota bacterium]